jgi:type II secretory pathway pseudopilin PulG
MSILGILGTLVSPVANAYKAKQDVKIKANEAQASITLAKQSGETQHTLNRDQWEALSKQAENGTWKDEYVTIVITSPFVLLFVASVVSGFTGDMRFVDAVNLGIANLSNLGIDLGYLMSIVVLAAVGIKGVKSVLK